MGLGGGGTEDAEYTRLALASSGQRAGETHQASISGGIDEIAASVTITWVIRSVVSPMTISGTLRILVSNLIAGAQGGRVRA